MFGRRNSQDRVAGKTGHAVSGSLTAAGACADAFIGPRINTPGKPAIGGRRIPDVLRFCSILLATLCVMAGAASELGRGAYAPPRVPCRPPAPPSEVGVASWYGHPYHGRRAANGEKYDMNQLTAAHRFLPFGTRVRVHSLSNARTVEVRITDRGPFVEGRLVDLSRAAARYLGFHRAGLELVRLEVLSDTATPGGDPGVGSAN